VVRDARFRWYGDAKIKNEPRESWRQMSMDNGDEEDRIRDGSMPSSTIWSQYDSRQRMLKIVLNEKGEPPNVHKRNSQERKRRIGR